MTGPPSGCIRIFLAGDVMTGRGIDQVMAHPSDPRLHESCVTNARDYVRLAERRNGPVPRQVPDGYVWGDLPAELATRRCDLRIVNLETAITRSDTPEPKGINYRMNPANAGVLTAAGIDACILANNHVMDWGRRGLLETLDTLSAAGIGSAGAGRNAGEAAAPLVLSVAGRGRVIVVAFGSETSGVPPGWAASGKRAGVNMLPPSADEAVARVNARLGPLREPGDIVLVSVHWGGNWGYGVPDWQRQLAHALIEEAGVGLVFGHSSHHPKAAELHRRGLILYGCGDLINDYEGIGGFEEFRDDLGLAWFVDMDTGGGGLAALEMVPFRRRRFRLERARADDARWLAGVLARRAPVNGAKPVPTDRGTLRLVPDGDGP